MKKIAVGIISLIVPVLFAGTVQGAWEFTRVSTNSGQSLYPAVSAVGNHVYVAWMDDSYGNYDIFYKRSWTSGAEFQVFERLSNNPGESSRPAIAAYVPNGNKIHTVWQDGTYHATEIFYKRSTDYGGSWSFQRLTHNIGDSDTPAVAIWDNDVNVVWMDRSWGNREIFFKRSTNSGLAWDYQRLSNSEMSSIDPDVAVGGNVIHVVWADNIFGPDYEILYKRSTDHGASWSYQRLTDVLFHSNNPSIAASGSTVHVVWNDSGSFGNHEIFYKRSTDYGATWSFQRISNNSGSSSMPSVSSSGTNVAIVWQDDTYGQDEIFSKWSANNGVSWNFARISDNSGASQYPSVSVTSSDINVVWSDNTFGNWEIFFKRGP